MRIALNAMQVRAAKSGVGQTIHALLEAMLFQERSEQFVVYTSLENSQNYRWPAPNLENTTWGLGTHGKALRLAYEHLALPSELRRNKIDVFHGCSNFLPARKVCPSVVTIYDLSYFVDPQRCPFLRRQYWYAMTRRTVSLADAIITISENSRRDIERFFPGTASRISVIPLAAHSRFRRVEYGREESVLPRLGIAQPYVLFVGTLEPGKNVTRVIQAFDSIAGEFPDHLLLIAGDRGWLFDEIFRTAESANAKDRIRFLGHVPDADVVDLFNFCEVFVFPSLYEGFGLPPLEAMACGAPVITSATSSLPEVVGDAALTLSPESTGEIASALRRVLADSDLRNVLRKKGIERAAAFSWNRTAAETLSVYRRIAAR